MEIKLKPEFKIVIYYALFGILWIIYSDNFIDLISNQTHTHSSFQTYKGLFFIFITSILLFKMIERYLESERYDKEMLLEKELKLDQINENMNNLFDLSIKMMSPYEYSDESFIKEIFRFTSNLSEVNDFGSAYIIKNCRIEFIDHFGFNSKELKKMEEDINICKISPKCIIVKRYKEEEKVKNKDLPLKNIKESIYISIYKNRKIIGGFNLHISDNSDKSYSANLINRMQVIQDLANGFYRIKKYNDYKSMLQNDIVQSFIKTLEFHDDYTRGHSELVAKYSLKIGEVLGLEKKELEDLYWAAIMHDIGKIIIPVDILNKKEKLSDSEFHLIKKHPVIGYKIISKSETLKNISEFVLYHHERWDGKGYPKGLKGNEIPLLSQIISVGDSWHAMTSERPYKNKLSVEEGIEELIRNRGTQFSPEILDVFIENKCYLVD
jgi:HD-GYP domain-containing protein (c-di-GMP phosphodiesterase class II)